MSEEKKKRKADEAGIMSLLGGYGSGSDDDDDEEGDGDEGDAGGAPGILGMLISGGSEELQVAAPRGEPGSDDGGVVGEPDVGPMRPDSSMISSTF